MIRLCRATTPSFGYFLHVMPLRDNRLNTPAEMLVRLVYASRFFFFLIGLMCSASALHIGSVSETVKALFFFSAMIAGHQWLKRRGKLAECDRALDTMFRGDVSPDENDGLESLLQRRAALEKKRGQPGFDPWAVQAVRREINDYVRQHPESTGRLDQTR
jgi:hypothetical protein